MQLGFPGVAFVADSSLNPRLLTSRPFGLKIERCCQLNDNPSKRALTEFLG